MDHDDRSMFKVFVRMKRLISFFIAAAFAISTGEAPAQQNKPPAAHTAVTAFINLPDLSGDPANKGSQPRIAVAEIPAEDQIRVASHLAHSGIPGAFFVGPNDPVSPALASDPSALVYKVGNTHDIHHSEGVPADVRAHYRNVALTVALINASGYFVAFYFLTSDALKALGAGGYYFALSSILSVWSHKWSMFVHFNGDQTRDVVSWVAARFGRPLSPTAKLRWQRVGNVGAIYGLNLVNAGVIMHLGAQHSPESLPVTLVIALLLSSEAGDLVAERYSPTLVDIWKPVAQKTSRIWTDLLKQSEIEQLRLTEWTALQNSILARQILFGVAEWCAIGGMEDAKLGTAVIVTGLIGEIVFHEELAEISRQISRRISYQRLRRGLSPATFQSRASSIVLWPKGSDLLAKLRQSAQNLRRRPTSAKKMDCQAALKVPDDIQ